MGTLLIIVGLVWAIIGVANIAGMPWNSMAPGSPLATFGLMFNMLLFVLPGLVVAGIGSVIGKRKRRSDERAADQQRGQGQVADLAAQWSRGELTDEEYFGKRDAIVAPERKCPFCAEMIKAEAIVCRFCGRDLPKDGPRSM